MSDYTTKALEEYSRLLAQRPKSLDELSKKWQRVSLLKAGGQENPIEIYSSEKEDPEEYPEEDPDEDPVELEDYLEEPVSEDVVLANDENGAQEEDSVIEDSSESFEYFEIFGSKNRKRNIVRKRPFRPRSCKNEKDFPFAVRVVSKSVRLEFDEPEVESVPQRLLTELRRLA